MNPIGIYYAFLSRGGIVDWHGCIERTARAGAEILECSGPQMLKMDADERKEIARHAKDAGIELTMAVCLTEAADISAEASETRNAGAQLLMDYATVASEMGMPLFGGILTGAGKRFANGIARSRDLVLQRAAPYLYRAAEHARQIGVVLALETVNRFESPLINTAQEALKMVEAVNSPALGIHLDTFHMNIEESSFSRAIQLAGKRLVHFHACENDRSLPGQAHIPWKEVLSALRAIDYKGRIVIESLPGPYGDLPERLNIWRVLSRDPDAELERSIRYLHSEWEALS